MYPVHEAIENLSGLGGIGLYGVVMMIALILGDYSLLLRLLITLVVLYAVTVIIRSLYFKERPEKRKYNNAIGKIDASSFPSLHSARALALAVIIGISLQNIILLAFLLFSALVVAATRVLLKKHDIIDILGGAIMGVIFGLLTFLLHFAF